MKLEDLKKQIPFKWRVQSAKDWGADCVAYIDARESLERGLWNREQCGETKRRG